MLEKLIVRLIGDGGSYNAMLATATAQTKQFESTINNVSGQIRSVGRTATNLGRTLSLVVTLPLIGMGAAAVNEFAKFDQAMTQSTSIMSVTAEQTERMRDLALSLAGQAIQGPAELGKAYFFLASAGLNAEQSMAALPRVIEFATAGAFDMALATDLLTDAQSALGLSVGTTEERMAAMTRVSDVLVKANTLANATVQQFSESLTNDAGAALKIYNKDVEEGVAVLAAYADQGVKGQVAGSQLGRVTRLLSQSALKQAEAHTKLGFAVFDNNGKMRNYADIIANLEQITKGMSDETRAATLEQLGFQARVQNAILPLIGMSDQIRTYEAALRQAGGTTAQVAANQMQSFSNQIQVLRNQVTILAIRIGQALAPTVLKLNEIMRSAIGWFNGLDSSTQTLIATVVAITAVLGPLLVVFGMVAQAVAALLPIITSVGGAILAFTNPVTATIAVVIGLIAALRLMAGSWQNVERIVAGAVDFMVDHVIMGLRIMGRTTTVLAGWLKANFMKIFTVDFVGAVVAGIKAAATKISQFAQWAIRKLRAVFTGEETGTLEDFLGFVSRDFAAGANTTDLLGTLGSIVGEERSALAARRAGRQVLPTEARERLEPVETKMVEASDTASSAVEKMAGDIRQLVEIGKKELSKQGIELAPLALTR